MGARPVVAVVGPCAAGKSTPEAVLKWILSYPEE